MTVKVTVKMKMIFYILCGVVILIAGFLVFRPKEVVVESVRVQRQDFVETLSVEGKIHSRTRQTLYAYATGNISSTKFKVGDTLKKGEEIAKLEWDKIVAIRSPLDGVITKIYRDSAGPINRGEPLFEVSSLSDLEVVVDLLTPEAVRLSLKGRAQIKNWGGEEDLIAQIFQISKAGAVKTSALGVEEERTEVRLVLSQIPEVLKTKLGDNYHVDVVFQISQVAQALTLPLGALFKNGDNWAIYVIENKRAILREIKIGKKNDRVALVSEGLHEGEQVILFPGDQIREGTKVKAN